MIRPLRFSLRQLMVAIGIFGAILGLLCSRTPAATVVLLGVPALVGYLCYEVASFRAYPLWSRLGREIFALCLLTALSAGIWGGRYPYEEQRCEALARRCSVLASVSSPEVRAALGREAAWFKRRAAILRRRGLWIGLTKGPFILGGGDPACWDEVYELGLLERIEMHEKVLDGYSRARPFAP